MSKLGGRIPPKKYKTITATGQAAAMKYQLRGSIWRPPATGTLNIGLCSIVFSFLGDIPAYDMRSGRAGGSPASFPGRPEESVKRET